MNFLLMQSGSGTPSGVVSINSDAEIRFFLYLIAAFLIGLAVGIIGSWLVRLFIKYTNPIDIPEDSENGNTKEGE